jgi:cobalt-zinc-cadmium efflux system outer membrane protein
MSTRSIFHSSSRSIAQLAAISLFAFASHPAPAIAIDGPLELADEAVRENPGIEALQARTQALAAITRSVGTWQDPLLGIEYLNAPVDSFRLDRSPMSGLQFSLQQTLPEWGWSRASRQVAESRVEASRYAEAEAQVQLKRSVEVLFWRLAQSGLLHRVTRSHLARTQELLDAVKLHYEVGRVGQNAVLRLGVLRDRLRDDLNDFERADRQISAGLNGALARPARSDFETPGEVVPIPVDGSAVQWLDVAMRERPELKRIREEVRVEGREATLARIETRPDVNVWAKYRLRTVSTATDDGTDFVSVGMSVPIPWGSRKKGLGEEAAHREAERGARARLEAAADRIEAELHMAEAAWARAYEKATSYRDSLIPAARASLETTLADFSVGKADFASLYESEVELLMLENTFIAAAVETHMQSANARSISGSSNLGKSQ